MSRGLELLIAQTILQGFDAQYGRFLEVTPGAQQRFEHADWHAVQQAMKQRIIWTWSISPDTAAYALLAVRCRWCLTCLSLPTAAGWPVFSLALTVVW